MTTSTKHLTIAAVAVLLLGYGVADATVIVEHTGQTDPLTEGFIASSTGGSTDVGGNDGKDYREINGTAIARRNFRGDVSSYSIVWTDAWTASGEIKVVADSAFPGNSLLEVRTGNSERPITGLVSGGSGSFATEGMYYADDTGTYTLLQALDVNVYHTYQMVYDPDDNATAISWYVDGGFVAKKDFSQILDLSGFEELVFGDNATSEGIGAASLTRYAFARFETGVNIVPEPTTVALLGLGLVGLLGYRRIRT